MLSRPEAWGGNVRGSSAARQSTPRAMNVIVTPDNTAPVAVSSVVTTGEDDPYVFAWEDFHVSDVDSAQLSIVIGSLPIDGTLQRHDGVNWVEVTVGQTISRADIEAGLLCFGPPRLEPPRGI